MLMLHNLYIAWSIGISAVVLFLFALLQVISVPTGFLPALAMIPWTYGIYGVAGLLGCMWKPGKEGALRVRVEKLLLGLGLVGATIFGLIALVVPLFFLGPAQSAGLGIFFLILLVLFPVTPSVIAFKELSRLHHLSAQLPPDDARYPHAKLTLVLLIPTLVAGLHLSMQEAILWRYGHDLGSRAEAAAEVLARGRPICVISEDGTRSLRDLDGRTEVKKALGRRFNMSRNQFPEPPHFGIHIDDQTHWWSFRLGNFFPEPPHWGNLMPHRFQSSC